MTAACDRCGDHGDLRTVDITDDSGACLARLCGGCYALLGRERCRLCGATKSPNARAHHATKHARDGPGGPICDKCRRQVLVDGVHQ